MTRAFAFAFAAAITVAATPAAAALKAGDKAPAITATAARAGKAETFRLADALKGGPVVLYFFPKAFTGGCDIQAKLFSDAVGDFRAHKATVVGVSRDGIEQLKKFSMEKCAGKFAVVSDEDGRITRAYDAVLPIKTEYANRTSYVIGRDGRIAYEYTALNPDKHVVNTLAAVRGLKGGKAH